MREQHHLTHGEQHHLTHGEQHHLTHGEQHHLTCESKAILPNAQHTPHATGDTGHVVTHTRHLHATHTRHSPPTRHTPHVRSAADGSGAQCGCWTQTQTHSAGHTHETQKLTDRRQAHTGRRQAHTDRQATGDTVDTETSGRARTYKEALEEFGRGPWPPFFRRWRVVGR
jgi:hypothetical protein